MGFPSESRYSGFSSGFNKVPLIIYVFFFFFFGVLDKYLNPKQNIMEVLCAPKEKLFEKYFIILCNVSKFFCDPLLINLENIRFILLKYLEGVHYVDLNLIEYKHLKDEDYKIFKTMNYQESIERNYSIIVESNKRMLENYFSYYNQLALRIETLNVAIMKDEIQDDLRFIKLIKTHNNYNEIVEFVDWFINVPKMIVTFKPYCAMTNMSFKDLMMIYTTEDLDVSRIVRLKIRKIIDLAFCTNFYYYTIYNSIVKKENELILRKNTVYNNINQVVSFVNNDFNSIESEIQLNLNQEEEFVCEIISLTIINDIEIERNENVVIVSPDKIMVAQKNTVKTIEVDSLYSKPCFNLSHNTIEEKN